MQFRAYRRTYINTDGVTGVDARTDRPAGGQAGRYIQSGFLGHLNDAQQFALMDQLGTDLEFPDNCYMYLLGDNLTQIEETLLHSLRYSKLLESPGIKEGTA